MFIAQNSFPNANDIRVIAVSAASGTPIELMTHFISDFFVFQNRSDDCIHTSVKNVYDRK